DVCSSDLRGPLRKGRQDAAPRVCRVRHLASPCAVVRGPTGVTTLCARILRIVLWELGITRNGVSARFTPVRRRAGSPPVRRGTGPRARGRTPDGPGWWRTGSAPPLRRSGWPDPDAPAAARPG